MAEENNVVSTLSFDGDVDPILPDGWEEGQDLFAGADEPVKEPIADQPDEAGSDDTFLQGLLDDEKPKADDTTNDTKVEEETAQEELNVEEEQTKDSDEEPVVAVPASRKLKLKVNHKEEEVDINSMTDDDLVALLQKGKAFDALKDSENKKKFREVYQEQLDAGMTEAVAKVVASSEAGGKTYSLTDEEDVAEQAPAQPEPQVVYKEPVRDTAQEVAQLKALYPDFKEMPDEVAKAYASGIPLLTAYLAYREKQSSKTAAALKKENEILKQNAAAAAKAPVSGVSGGGDISPKQKDPFEIGFDSDNW